MFVLAITGETGGLLLAVPGAGPGGWSSGMAESHRKLSSPPQSALEVSSPPGADRPGRRSAALLLPASYYYRARNSHCSSRTSHANPRLIWRQILPGVTLQRDNLSLQHQIPKSD